MSTYRFEAQRSHGKQRSVRKKGCSSQQRTFKRPSSVDGSSRQARRADKEAPNDPSPSSSARRAHSAPASHILTPISSLSLSLFNLFSNGLIKYSPLSPFLFSSWRSQKFCQRSRTAAHSMLTTVIALTMPVVLQNRPRAIAC